MRRRGATRASSRRSASWKRGGTSASAIAAPEVTAPVSSGSRAATKDATTSPPMLWPTRKTGSPGARAGERDLEVVEQVGEAPRVAPGPRRPAVPAVVVGVHRAAARRQPGAHLLVAAAVLRPAVDQQHAALGALREPGAAEEI